MRILFVGTVKFSYEALKRVLRSEGSIVGCITKPERGNNADYVDMVPLCKDNGLPI